MKDYMKDYCLHSFEELGREDIRKRVTRIMHSNNYVSERMLREGDRVLEEAQKDMSFVRIFHRPLEEDENRITKDSSTRKFSKNGNEYLFETFNLYWLHETKVFCNGALVKAYPIGFCHNYNFTKFCEWVVESIL